MTIATPLWQGLDKLAAAFREAAPLYAGADLNAFTMTGELSDIFPSRDAGVAALLEQISEHFPSGKEPDLRRAIRLRRGRAGRAAKHGRRLRQLARDGRIGGEARRQRLVRRYGFHDH